MDGNAHATARNGYSGPNPGHYSNQRMTDLIDRYRATLEAPARGPIVREISLLFRDELPFLPIFFFPVYATVSSSVRALDDMDSGHTGGGGYFGGYPRAAHLWEKDV